ncbi:hypothetical protein HMPREF3191_00515 [Veillonellaceae bacterium DNF00626]|nr:hypothetical protein HMPREF3191_00515 [Veillonellaceae bacterium DNF00626]
MLFDGKLLDEMSYRESALKLAVVAQHNFYHFDFTVFDVVFMGRPPHKKNRKTYVINRFFFVCYIDLNYVRKFTPFSRKEREKTEMTDIKKQLLPSFLGAKQFRKDLKMGWDFLTL